jgi:hypothetical protein
LLIMTLRRRRYPRLPHLFLLPLLSYHGSAAAAPRHHPPAAPAVGAVVMLRRFYYMFAVLASSSSSFIHDLAASSSFAFVALLLPCVHLFHLSLWSSCGSWCCYYYTTALVLITNLRFFLL